ncbi:MAG: peptide chain release factor N(5)-glutamine methyltransferase [Lentisphaerae bacterium]|nr:peptide chain release factor N(5)-glutamine methyltransferase [Lentisphaerota bacterium]
MNELVALVADILRNGGVENFRQESRWIAEDAPDADSALDYARRRAGGEPLQYILGSAPFRNLMLKVDSRVLIPRPETETLVQWLIDRVPYGGKVLDIGCGSGAIAISLAGERPDLQLFAADISLEALMLAKENAELCGVNVKFFHSDIFSAFDGEKFDFIAANLPYVTEDEYAELDSEVRDYEPKLALTADDDGLALIFRTIDGLPAHLSGGGGVIFELSPHQAPRCCAALEKIGMRSMVIKDLCQRDRFVAGISL